MRALSRNISWRHASSLACHVLMQFECGTRILRVIHGRDARATWPNCISTTVPRFTSKTREVALFYARLRKFGQIKNERANHRDNSRAAGLIAFSAKTAGAAAQSAHD